MLDKDKHKEYMLKIIKEIFESEISDDVAFKGGTLLSNKLVALYDRKENRDLYDVNFFFKKGFHISKDIISERLGMDIKVFLEKLIIIIKKNYNSKSVLHKLGDIVDNKQKFWIKNKLIEEVYSQITNYLKLN